MKIISVGTVQQWNEMVRTISQRSPRDTNIHVCGEIYSDVSRAYVAYGKRNSQHTVAKVSMGGAATAGVLGTIIFLTGGLALIPLGAGLAGLVGGSHILAAADKEFKASPYAGDILELSNYGFSLKSNDPQLLVLG